MKSIVDVVATKPIEWLESQSGYWRGKATVRRPTPDVDIWSEEALRGHRLAGEYELAAEQVEMLRKARAS